MVACMYGHVCGCVYGRGVGEQEGAPPVQFAITLQEDVAIICDLCKIAGIPEQ